MKRLLIIMMIAVVAHAFGQENKEGGEKRTIAAIASGYESIAWGTKLSDARDKIDRKSVV